MLLLTNQEIASLLSIEDCLAALEKMYRAMAGGEAVGTPRIDTMLALDEEHVYSFKQMGGVIRGGIQALRVNSDVLEYPLIGDARRRVKLPRAKGRWVGLIYLFDPETGLPEAILPDGVIQHLRVGATSGLAARELAPRDCREVALLGSGWQAESALLALDAVLRPQRVHVYSPDPDHRRAFREKMAGKVSAEVVEEASAAAAVAPAAVVFSATNSMSPVLTEAWIRPGMHFSTVKTQEVDAAFLARGRVFLHTRGQLKQQMMMAAGQRSPEAEEGWWRGQAVHSYPDLVDLLSGKVPGRQGDEEVTIFVNNIGLGLQFAAVGAVVLSKARELGVGRDLPDHWFTEDVHP